MQVWGLWHQKQVSKTCTSNRILWDVITYPGPRYLLLAPKSSCVPLAKKNKHWGQDKMTAILQMTFSNAFSSFLTWAEATARQDEKHLSFGIWCHLFSKFDGMLRLVVSWCHWWSLKFHRHLQPPSWCHPLTNKSVNTKKHFSLILYKAKWCWQSPVCICISFPEQSPHGPHDLVVLMRWIVCTINQKPFSHQPDSQMTQQQNQSEVLLIMIQYNS